jgi:UDP-3-O-[3-hydroxymyristoyl] glucosamine N-acyltransferase
MSQGFTLQELAGRVGGQVEGDGSVVLTGLSTLELALPGQLSFVTDQRHAKQLAATKASAVLVGKDHPPVQLPLLRVGNVQVALAAVMAMLEQPADLPKPGVHPSAIVSPQAQVDPSAAVGPFVVVGAKAVIGPRAVLAAHVVVEAETEIGEDTILYPGTVVVARSRIGRRCRIGPNAVIGSSGFGYFFNQGCYRPFPHIGTVQIGDDVDIGACACVDRAKFGVTRVGSGTKIDNLVQVAHNVQVGENCVLAALVGIAGSAVLNEGVVLGGHAGVRDSITVGRGVQAGACAIILQDVADGQTVMGLPAMDKRQWLRVQQASQSLPELRLKVRELERRLEKLEPKQQ